MLTQNMNHDETIRHLEECLIDPKWQIKTDFLNQVIDDEFEESNPLHEHGKTVGKKDAIAWLTQQRDESVSWSILQFSVKMLTHDIAIAQYLSQKTDTRNNTINIKYYRRLSIWKKQLDHSAIPWTLVFHQSINSPSPS